MTEHQSISYFLTFFLFLMPRLIFVINQTKLSLIVQNSILFIFMPFVRIFHIILAQSISYNEYSYYHIRARRSEQDKY